MKHSLLLAIALAVLAAPVAAQSLPACVPKTVVTPTAPGSAVVQVANPTSAAAGWWCRTRPGTYPWEPYALVWLRSEAWTGAQLQAQAGAVLAAPNALTALQEVVRLGVRPPADPGALIDIGDAVRVALTNANPNPPHRVGAVVGATHRATYAVSDAGARLPTVVGREPVGAPCACARRVVRETSTAGIVTTYCSVQASAAIVAACTP